MNKKRFLILLIATINGAVVMAFEIIGSRVLAPTFGGSIFVWGSLIGVVMAGLSAGYFLGGWLSDIRGHSPRILSILLAIPGILLAALPFFGFSLSEWIFLKDLGPRMGPLFACGALFLLPTVLMGAVSPYLVGMMIADDSQKPGRAVGLVYALSTAGSIIGTLGAAFYMILVIGTKGSLYMLGGVLLALAAIALTVKGE